MKCMFWIVGLWLVGIGQAMAFDLKTPETLKYSVFWGPVRVGGAVLSYAPAGQGYVVRADVQDDSSLISLKDSWESRGVHTATRAFEPATYHVVQAENKYRADKTMTFDRTKRQITFRNNLNPGDKVPALALTEARDVLSTVYAWRVGGAAEAAKAAEVEMVSLKRPITLKRSAGLRETLTTGTKKETAWKVQFNTVRAGGKVGKETWTVYLRDDAALTPVRIVAATKFGTFRAVLDQ